MKASAHPTADAAGPAALDAGDPVAALARLAVGAGANVAPGQTVVLDAKLGQEDLARAVAAECYARGAHQLEVRYGDPHVDRARLALAPEEALGTVIPWVRDHTLQMGELRCAWIGLSGPVAPGLLDDVDPARIGRDSVALVEWSQVLDARTVNWTIVPGPSPGWASLVFPDLGPEAAVARLWSELHTILRLDAADPVAAWRERSDELTRSAARLDAAVLDALHFSGPGTDLTVGLLPGVRWAGGSLSTVWGREHLPNLPTEEVFTSPDPERTEGTVAATKPLLISGRAIEGLRVRFEAGRAVAVDADEGASVLRELIQRDENANRLGEVALVDGSGRVGPSGIIFNDTLLDENAASHIALGAGFVHLAADDAAAGRINDSGVHTDFMIGGPEVTVTGITRDGHEIPVLAGGDWALE